MEAPLSKYYKVDNLLDTCGLREGQGGYVILRSGNETSQSPEDLMMTPASNYKSVSPVGQNVGRDLEKGEKKLGHNRRVSPFATIFGRKIL